MMHFPITMIHYYEIIKTNTYELVSSLEVFYFFIKK